MQIILTPQRSEAHTVKIDDKTQLVFEPKVPTEVPAEQLAHLREDFRDRVLLVCRQDKATGRVEYAEKLTRTLAIASDDELIAIADGESIKAKLSEILDTDPAQTIRQV